MLTRTGRLCQNLLGCCFNNAVDYEATKACCESVDQFFPNGRVLMVPTETCKMGPFTLTRELVESWPCRAAMRPLQTVLAEDIGQWTDMKRGEAQALFDAVTVMPLSDLAEHCALIQAVVVFGKNKFALGTLYEDLGVALRNASAHDTQAAGDGVGGRPPSAAPAMQHSLLSETPMPESLHAVPGRVTLDSPFPGGTIYATERVFSEGCSDTYTSMVREIIM